MHFFLAVLQPYFIYAQAATNQDFVMNRKMNRDQDIKKIIIDIHHKNQQLM